MYYLNFIKEILSRIQFANYVNNYYDLNNLNLMLGLA